MIDSRSISVDGGCGVRGLLGVLFVGLKLTHVIDWSWWWVTAPFWGMFALVLVVIGFAALVIFAQALLSVLRGR